MPKLVQTHINALYADLLGAKQTAAIAQGEVDKIEDAIRARGGEVPGEDAVQPDRQEEDTASAEDVSATEHKPSNKFFKKGDK